MEIDESTQYTWENTYYNGVRITNKSTLRKISKTIPRKHIGLQRDTFDKDSIISINKLSSLLEDNEEPPGNLYYVLFSHQDGLYIAQKVSNDSQYYLKNGQDEEYLIDSKDLIDELLTHISGRDKLPYTLINHPIYTLGLDEQYSSAITSIKIETNHVSDEWLIQQTGENELIRYFI